MKAERFIFVFGKEEYKISCYEVSIVDPHIKNGELIFYNGDFDDKFAVIGKCLHPQRPRFYELFVFGENNYKLAQKYFIKLLKTEAKHSVYHNARYEFYINQLKKKGELK